MEVRPEGLKPHFVKLQAQTVIPRIRLQLWFIFICSSIVLWTCLVQLCSIGKLRYPHLFTGFSTHISQYTSITSHISTAIPTQPSIIPARSYSSNGFLKISCNGGLNQMRAAICDMVAVARLLNLTLIVPELDKASFWADPSNFGDIFDVQHFIDSLRDDVQIVRRLPKRLNRKYGYQPHVMPPVSWSNESYYLDTVLPLFRKHEVLHFNRTDTRLANNGVSLWVQRLRCRVNYEALKFTDEIESLANEAVRLLRQNGRRYAVLHLRYEMDMLAFSGCTHGCSQEEAEELKWLRYTYPWWREKEIISEERRSQGLCPLTPEEASLTLKALGFDNKTQIYIASGDIYGGHTRLAALRAAFPLITNKEMMLGMTELRRFENHSSQMAALDFIVSVASDVFIPTYDGNMAKVVEGHRRYLGFGPSILLDRKRLVGMLDKLGNGSLSWPEFVVSVRHAHQDRTGRPTDRRRRIPSRPKEEDYFYANPHECFCPDLKCDASPSSRTHLIR